MLDSPSLGWTVLAFIALLGPLVFFHELGHYLVGRWCGIGAQVFSIGFGREIFGWTDKRGTRWKIGWLPLGGYVQFMGDEDAVSTPHEVTRDEPAGSFAAAVLWKRSATVAAGPIANFLLAIVILTGFALAYGKMTTPPVASMVQQGSPADTAGITPGDRIVSVDGRAMTTFQDIPMAVMHRPGEAMDFVVDRGGRQMTLRIAPTIVRENDSFGNPVERAIIGIRPGAISFEAVGVAQAPIVATTMAWSITRQMAEVIGQLLTGQRSIKDMGGPLKIAQVSGQQASLGIAPFLYFAALISLNLGFVNLLPMPMLDGGHLLFNAVEAVRRRPVSVPSQQMAFRFGFAAMITLMIVVTFNDLSSFGLWQKLAGLIG
ncbi:MAG: RIP metalloprotease RseP [Pseudomonadota bacterium]